MLNEINTKKFYHKKRGMYYRKIDSIFEGILVALNAITLSSVVVQYMKASPYLMFFSTIVSSLTVIGATVKKSMGLASKWTESKSIYIALNNLSSETSIILAKNHLSSEQLDNMLLDIHNRLSLLMERSPMIDDGQQVPNHLTLTPEMHLREIAVDTPVSTVQGL
jgi:hypothetical protein